MFRSNLSFFVLAIAITLSSTVVSRAAEATTTTITIQGMHCGGCAAKVSRQLLAVDGVATAEADAVKAVAVISPKTNANLSPRSLWEAIEKAGYKPTKLVGPSGTFTEKPKS
jgi:copper chaperone CopZ